MARVNNRKSTALVPVEEPAAPQPTPAQPTGKGPGRKPAAPVESSPPPPPKPRRSPPKPAPVPAPPVEATPARPLKNDVAAAARELEKFRRQARTAHAEWMQAAREQVRTLQESFVGAQQQLGEAVQLQVQQLRQLLQLLQELPEQVITVRQQLRQLPEEVGSLRQELEDLRRQLPLTVHQAQQIREELERVRRHARAAQEQVEDVKHEMLEVVPQSAAPPAAIVLPAEGRNRLGLTVAPSVVIAEVQPGAAGARAGLTRGDVVTAVNGEHVPHAAKLRSLVQDSPADEALTLQVVRGGTTRDVSVAPEERGEDESPPAEGHDRLGVTVGPGVVVDEVAPGTPAAGAGLARGDVIVALNSAPVVSGEELRLAVHQCAPGEEVTLQVFRFGDTRDVKVRLDEPAPPMASP